MQSIYLEDQKKLNIIGATKIISSTNTQAVVESENNNIIITGTDLEITNLNLENREVSFAGTFTSIKLSNTTEKKGFFKRLFK